MIMTTEKDIRKFMQDNKIRIPKDDGFMEDLLRQIDLLPTPASLSSDCAEDISSSRIGADGRIACDEQLTLLFAIRDAMKKRNRKIAVEVIVISMVVCGLIMLLTVLADSFVGGTASSVPDSVGLFLKYRYLISSIICSVFVLVYSYRVYNEFC